MPELRTISAVLGIAALLCPAALADDPASRADIRRTAELIAQLGDSRFEQREAAARALAALGVRARGPLEQALHSDDAEVRRRARQLLLRLERHQEAERLLAPTRVQLAYREVPVARAAADLSRKIGLPIHLEGGWNSVAGRQVTLAGEDLSFWEAIDLFCRKAEVREPVPSGVAPDDRFAYDADERRVYAIGSSRGSGRSPQDNLLLLRDGAPPALPLYLHGALRLRALPPGTPATGWPRSGHEVAFGLEVCLERRLRLRSVLALKVDRAVDDQGRILAQPPEAVPGAGAVLGSPAEEVVILWDGFSELPTDRRVSGTVVPVRLRAAGAASQRLREVQGTLALQVQRAPEALVTVDDVLRAAGKRIEGAAGNAVQVVRAERDAEGRVEVRVEVTPAADLMFAGFPARLLVLGDGRWRSRGIPVPPPVRLEQLALVDARERRCLPTSTTEPAANGTGTAWGLTLLFQPAQALELPARLEFTGYRTFTVEVPFTLRDVPLQ